MYDDQAEQGCIKRDEETRINEEIRSEVTSHVAVSDRSQPDHEFVETEQMMPSSEGEGQIKDNSSDTDEEVSGRKNKSLPFLDSEVQPRAPTDTSNSTQRKTVIGIPSLEWIQSQRRGSLDESNGLGLLTSKYKHLLRTN